MDDDTRFWLAKDMAETKFQHNADTVEINQESNGR